MSHVSLQVRIAVHAIARIELPKIVTEHYDAHEHKDVKVFMDREGNIWADYCPPSPRAIEPDPRGPYLLGNVKKPLVSYTDDRLKDDRRTSKEANEILGFQEEASRFRGATQRAKQRA